MEPVLWSKAINVIYTLISLAWAMLMVCRLERTLHVHPTVAAAVCVHTIRYDAARALFGQIVIIVRTVHDASQHDRHFILIVCPRLSIRFYGVVVIMLDSESSDRGSNPRRT